VSTVNGLQPFFVLLFGIVLTVVVPRLRGEKQRKSELAQKMSAITLMFAGTYLIAVQ
jgi:dipeptide/tripeptide permease